MQQGISRFRRGAIAAAATIATTAGLLPLAATGAGATASFDLARFAGVDRYDTAAKIATGSFTTADNVVLATGENFPDALAGNYLAGTKAAPILLTRKDSVPSQTSAALTALQAKNIFVMGGTDAIGAGGVPSGYTATRVAGATRYETAVQAGSTGTIGSVGGKLTAIVATGDKFADALSAGPGSYAGNFPLYLTPGAPATALHSATKAALTSRAIKHVILMGGTAAVSDAVKAEIEAMGITTERAAGADRTETARVFAEWLLANLGFTNTHMNVARGDLFPDALAGGPHAGKEKAPILLTWTPQEASPGNSASLGALKYASDHKATLTGGHIYGGTDAVSAAVEAAIEAAGGKGGVAGNQTARPELQTAQIVSTTTTGNATPTNPAGTVVSYTFDEPVAVANLALFKVYTFGGAATAASAATVSTTNSSVVNALFPAFNTAALAQTLSVATVAQGAVTDGSGTTNPEGDSAIGTGGTATLTAGVTAAPDLTTVAGFRQGALANDTAVDFTFDEAAFTTVTTGFHLVLTSGTVVNCVGPTSAATTPGGGTATSPTGYGTTVLTVVCDNTATGAAQPIPASAVARGYVDQGTVGDSATGTNLNPQQAADVSNNGNDVRPSLVSATFTPGATSSTSDTVVYTFSQPVATPTATAFYVYLASSGAEVHGTTTATVNPSDATQVAVTYVNGTLAGAVGAGVHANAVIASTGAAAGAGNQPDEVAVSNAATSTTVSGRTSGPDLTSVKLTSSTVGFTTTYLAIYTFDQAVGTVNAGAAQFKLFLADGSQYDSVAAGCSIGTAPNNNTVTCAFGAGGGPTTAASGAATAKLGTVVAGAVTAASGGVANPEGAEPAA